MNQMYKIWFISPWPSMVSLTICFLMLASQVWMIQEYQQQHSLLSFQAGKSPIIYYSLKNYSGAIRETLVHLNVLLKLIYTRYLTEYIGISFLQLWLIWISLLFLCLGFVPVSPLPCFLSRLIGLLVVILKGQRASVKGTLTRVSYTNVADASSLEEKSIFYWYFSPKGFTDFIINWLH